MDGPEPVQPGGSFLYEFEAKPAGLHVHHCHVQPFTRHIHKGLYGNFIIDPLLPRAPAKELTMVMNGFDLDLDGENEIYTVNGYAFACVDGHLIRLSRRESQALHQQHDGIRSN